jgi:hypothetical protein
MSKLPSLADYVHIYFTLFDRFRQTKAKTACRGRSFTYTEKLLIVFFTMMLIRRITNFKAQHRWLTAHRENAQQLGFPSIPHRTTLSRRFKNLSTTVRAFVAFVGWWAEDLHAAFSSQVLIEDASLFKAQGPVWHQSDRKAKRIPKGLRNLDTQATWGKSAYHGWVYGYSLHLTCTQTGFPKFVQTETACVDESQVLEQKAPNLFRLLPEAVVGDNAYFKALRVRHWAEQGVILLTPADQWQKGRYAQAYHRFIQLPRPAKWLACRKTAIEPVFDLFNKVLGTTQNHKQLSMKGLANVKTFLSLGVLAVQMAMIANNVWNLPLRQISNILTVFS